MALSSRKLVCGVLVSLVCFGSLTSCDRVKNFNPFQTSPDQLVVGDREVKYLYRVEDGQRKIALRHDEIPVPSRGSVIVYGGSSGVQTPVDETSRLPTVNLLNAESGDELTIRNRSQTEFRRRAVSGLTGGWRGEQVEGQVKETARRFAADPLLWRVEEVRSPVYLFGSGRHPPGTEFYDLPPQVREAFDRVDRLVLPVDQDDVFTSAENKAKFRELIMLDQNESLRRKLSEEHWSTLMQLGIGSDNLPKLDRLTPGTIAIFVALDLRPEGEGVDFQAMAEARGYSIEILDSRLANLRNTRGALGLEELRGLLSAPEEVRRNRKKLVRAYRSGNVDRYRELHRADPSGTNQAFTRSYGDLNRKWVEKIEKHVEEGGAFIPLPARHLFVGESILEGLRKKGYEVSRVP
jgi:uncharacterized protein YbaP (TraB family)